MATAVGEGGRARGKDGVESGRGAAHGEAEWERGNGERLALEAGRDEEEEVR